MSENKLSYAADFIQFSSVLDLEKKRNKMILIRYLIKEVFKSQIAILLILLLIFFSQQFVRVLGAAANGNVPADLVFSLLGLGMPTMAQLMLPLC